MKSVYDARRPHRQRLNHREGEGTKHEAACVFFRTLIRFGRSSSLAFGTLEQARSWDDCPVRDTKDVGIDLMAQVAGSG